MFRILKVYGLTSGVFREVAPGVEAGVLIGRREDLEIASGYVFGRIPADRSPEELGLRRHVIAVRIGGGVSVPEHRHPFDQLSILIRGRLNVCVEENCHMLEPGDSIYIPSGLRHSSEAVKESFQVEVRYGLRDGGGVEAIPKGRNLELRDSRLIHVDGRAEIRGGKWIASAVSGRLVINDVEYGGVVVVGEGRGLVDVVEGYSVILQMD